MGKLKLKETKEKFYNHVEISAALIVKNESENIRRCLDSIKWCDEIIVVDTGSDDNTMDIIRDEYPSVKLYEFPWEGNYFSVCRNHSLSKVTKNWTLIIDADEEWVFEDGSTVESLKAELLTLPVNKIGTVKIQLDDYVKGNIAASFKPTRLFPAKAHLKYKSTVHNEPVFKGMAAVCGGVKILHYGYDVESDRAKFKVEQTAGLLKKRLKTDPKDHEAVFYLAQIYSAYLPYQNYEKTMEWAEVYFNMLDDIPVGRVRRNLFYSAVETARRLKDFETAIRWVEEGRQRFGKDLDLNYAMMLLGIETQNPAYVIMGATGYVTRYNEMEKDPLVQSAGFVFTKKPLNLLNAFHKLGLMRLQESMHCLASVDQLLMGIPMPLKTNIFNDIKRELTALGFASIAENFQSNKVVMNLP